MDKNKNLINLEEFKEKNYGKKRKVSDELTDMKI